MISLLIFCLISLVTGTVSEKREVNPCGEWSPFADEKCFQFFSHERHGGPMDFVAAEEFCLEHDRTSSLASITSKEEHVFVTNLLYDDNQVDDLVWLGARFVNESFAWPDGSPLEFTNWSEGSPKNISDYCVLLESERHEQGKWTDVPCSRRNYVLCQKPQKWPLAQVQKTVLKLRKLLRVTASELLETQNKLRSTAKKLNSKASGLKVTTNHLNDVTIALKSVKEEMDELKESVIPPGFLYAQIFGQKSPVELWPNFEWQDVSEKYAGQFFRVLGGNSSAWGTQQSASSPRITHAEILLNGGKSDSSIILPREGWSDGIFSETSPTNGGLSFYTRNDEVRPANEPIKLWLRI